MKSFALFVSLALFALFSCKERAQVRHGALPVSGENGSIDLKLMSFNVRYENREDAGSRNWSQRVIGSVRMIREENPDVFGVQEALHGQAADLWASLPDYQFFGVGRDDGLRLGEYSGIFYRSERFELDASDCGTFWLSDTPEKPGSMTWGNEFPRIVAWIHLLDRQTGRGLYVFNTHWDHRNQLSREKAALLLSQRIENRKHPEQPVVLLGDFNAKENNPGVAFLLGKSVRLDGHAATWQNRLLDTFRCLHPNQGACTTLHFWSASRGGDLMVDHILVSTGAKVLASTIRDWDKPMVSDHFPVTSRVKFP